MDTRGVKLLTQIIFMLPASFCIIIYRRITPNNFEVRFNQIHILISLIGRQSASLSADKEVCAPSVFLLRLLMRTPKVERWTSASLTYGHLKVKSEISRLTPFKIKMC